MLTSVSIGTARGSNRLHFTRGYYRMQRSYSNRVKEDRKYRTNPKADGFAITLLKIPE